jgi:hypothetical protein
VTVSKFVEDVVPADELLLGSGRVAEGDAMLTLTAFPGPLTRDALAAYASIFAEKEIAS